MKSLVSAIFLCIYMTICVGQKSKPNCDRNVFDTCANRLLMLGDETFVFPNSMEKMNKRCKEIKSLEKCTKEYAKECLRGDTRNSISVLMYGISKTNKGYCSGPSRKKTFISFSGCLNSNKKRLDQIMHQMNCDFHGIKTYKDSKLKIPLGCCNYYKFKQDLKSYLTGRCKEKDIDEAEILIDSYAHDILNLLCGDYTEHSDKCLKIIGETPKWNKPLTSKVFVIPMVDVLDSL